MVAAFEIGVTVPHVAGRRGEQAIEPAVEDLGVGIEEDHVPVRVEAETVIGARHEATVVRVPDHPGEPPFGEDGEGARDLGIGRGVVDHHEFVGGKVSCLDHAAERRHRLAEAGEDRNHDIDRTPFRSRRRAQPGPRIGTDPGRGGESVAIAPGSLQRMRERIDLRAQAMPRPIRGRVEHRRRLASLPPAPRRVVGERLLPREPHVGICPEVEDGVEERVGPGASSPSPTKIGGERLPGTGRAGRVETSRIDQRMRREAGGGTRGQVMVEGLAVAEVIEAVAVAVEGRVEQARADDGATRARIRERPPKAPHQDRTRPDHPHRTTPGGTSSSRRSAGLLRQPSEPSGTRTGRPRRERATLRDATPEPHRRPKTSAARRMAHVCRLISRSLVAEPGGRAAAVHDRPTSV